MNYSAVKKIDPTIYNIILKEEIRNKNGLELIASENYASLAVMQATGSIFIDKYAEGKVGERFYEGNEFVDEVESLTIDRAKKVFQCSTFIWSYRKSFCLLCTLCTQRCHSRTRYCSRRTSYAWNEGKY